MPQEQFWVTINLQHLRASLLRATTKLQSDRDARDWLKRNGFKEAGSGWLANQSAMALLDPSVIVDVQVEPGFELSGGAEVPFEVRHWGISASESWPPQVSPIRSTDEPD